MPGVLVFAIALAALAAVFAIQNADVITISFFGWAWDASLALVLILTLGAGVLIGYLSGLPSTWRRQTLIRQQRRQLEELERDLPLDPAGPPGIQELDEGATDADRAETTEDRPY